MKRSSAMKHFVWAPWLLSLAALAGCEDSTRVGSGCIEGVCPQALSRNDDACTMTAVTAQITYTPGPQEPAAFGFCFNNPLQRLDDGTVQAHVYYGISASTEPSIDCTDRPYLKPVSDELRRDYLSDGSGFIEVCELNQLAIVEHDGGEPTIAAGDGFYYDDFSQELGENCRDGVVARLFVTAGALDLSGVTLLLISADVRSAEGDIDPELVCEPLRGSEPVGTACTPKEGTYDDNQVVLATRNDSCGDGVCMAYHWNGETEPSCEHADGGVCPTRNTMEERVYCTCRCDGPPGADLCECPEFYSCVDVISESVRADLAGRYCVKNGREGLP